MDVEEVKKVFSVDPRTIGLRHRGWWIIEKVEDEEERGHAQVGDLCVKARDGASNEMDIDAFRVGNCVGTAEDGFDSTYRYYYYRRITPEAPHA